MTDGVMERLFGDMAETIRRLARGEQQPTPARNAATVALVRDGAAGLEVYLLRRAASMSFAPGAMVFPGGSVDPRDQDIADEAWAGPAPSVWGEVFGCDEPVARALVCAAVRETFEESGVMLAGADAASVVADTSGDDWEADRLALLDRSMSLAELLRRRELVLRADLLRPWAHWITPDVEPKRFDTRFFVAAMPTGQRTRDVGGEADAVAWLPPAQALDHNQQGKIMLMPPTLATITDLARFADVAELLTAGEDRTVVAIRPKLILDDNDKPLFLLPDDPRYPADAVDAAG